VSAPAAAPSPRIPAQGGEMHPRPVSFGVDVVAVARAAQLLDRFGRSIVERVATGAEAQWVGGSPGRLGVVLGLKEAAIKAMAGRPDDFRWQQVETGVGSLVTTLDSLTDRPGGLPSAVGEVLREFADGMGLSHAQVATCRLGPAAQRRISPQLAGSGEILGIGVFGTDADDTDDTDDADAADGFGEESGRHVYAAVCFWRDAA
jgi:hypothetical protein